MNVLIETCSGLERKMKISIPAIDFEDQVQKKLRVFGKNLKLPGFRAGKVPLAELRKRFGERARYEISNEVMNKSFADIIEKEGIRYIGTPHSEILSMAMGEDFQFTITFDLYPDFSLIPLNRLVLKSVVTEIEDKHLDSVINSFKEQFKEWKNLSSEDSLIEGDKIVIDYEGQVDGESFKNSSGRNFVCSLGKGDIFPEFEKGLLDAFVGDEKNISFTFSEDYSDELLASKPVSFDVKVLSAQRAFDAELNQDFFSKFGIKAETIEEFREEMLNRLKMEVSQFEKKLLKDSVVKAVLEAHDFFLPNSLISSEIEQIRKQMFQSQSQMLQNQDEKIANELYVAFQKEHPDSEYREDAEKRVKLGIIFSRIMEENNLQISDEKVRLYIEQQTSQYPNSEEIVKYYYQNESLLKNIQSIVMEEQLIEFVSEQGKTEEVRVPYDELSSFEV